MAFGGNSSHGHQCRPTAAVGLQTSKMALGGSPWTRTLSWPPYISLYLFITAIESPDPSFYSWPCFLFYLSHLPVTHCPLQGRWRHVFLLAAMGASVTGAGTLVAAIGRLAWSRRQHSLPDKFFFLWLLGWALPGNPPSALTFLIHSPCFISIFLTSKTFSTFTIHFCNFLLVSCYTLNVGGYIKFSSLKVSGCATTNN